MPEYYPDPHGFDAPDAPANKCFCAYDDHGCSVHPLASRSKPLSDHERTKVDIATDSEYRRLVAGRDQAEINHNNAIIERVRANDAEIAARGQLGRWKEELKKRVEDLTSVK
jgi:hypothetical protein